MSPEEEARFRTLIEVNDFGGVGEFDGVRFDLRSELSDGGPKAGDWFSPVRIGDEDHPCNFWPFPHWRELSWPWARPDWVATYRERREAAIKRGIDPDSSRGRRFTLVGMARNFPEVSVEAGDTVFIDRVERDLEGDRFEPPEDAEVAYVFLAVRGADGETVNLEEPRRFTRWAAFGRRGDVERLADRASRRMGVDHIDAYFIDSDLISDGLSWAEAAFERTQGAIHRLREMLPRISGVEEDYPREPCQSLMEMADWFVSAGYALAKAEDAATMRPHAERGVAVSTGGAKGGRKSGLVRRQVREAKWEPHALDLAVSSRSKQPNRSQSDLASDIQALWKLEGDTPGFHWLLNFVRRAEADGQLPRRCVNGGAKGVRMISEGGSRPHTSPS